MKGEEKMAINWEKVRAYFCLKYEIFADEIPVDETLFCLFDFLYNVKKLSWRQIAEITDGYASSTTLKNKAKKLGIKMKGKGGPHFTKRKTLEIDELEYKTTTSTELAERYGVCRQVVIKIAKERGWPPKKAGRPRVLSVQGVTSYSDQEPLKSPRDF